MYLQANDGVYMTPLWCNKLKEYAIANFTTGVDEIFGTNGTMGAFPECDVLLDPIETDPDPCPVPNETTNIVNH